MSRPVVDKRNYPLTSAASGYGAWAPTYDETVAVGLDRPLLTRLETISWRAVRCAADLAAGTGRTGVWLAEAGVAAIDGLDLSPEMLERGTHPVRAAAAHAAMASFSVRQFHGSSSDSRLLGVSAMRASTSASQACGSTSLSFAVSRSV